MRGRDTDTTALRARVRRFELACMTPATRQDKLLIISSDERYTVGNVGGYALRRRLPSPSLRWEGDSLWGSYKCLVPA